MNADDHITRARQLFPSRLRFWYDHCKRKTQEDFMRTRMPLGIIPLLALSIAGTTNAQITKNRFPNPL